MNSMSKYYFATWRHHASCIRRECRSNYNNLDKFIPSIRSMVNMM
jgi:hypothetical protein